MKCPACLSTATFTSISYQNACVHSHPIFDGLELYACPECETAWVLNAPSNDHLFQYYAQSYEPARMSNRWPILEMRAVSLINMARLFCDFRPRELFVDLGPGNGSSLGVARYLLPRPRLGCVEFNVRSIAKFQERVPKIQIEQSIDAFSEVAMLYSAHCLEHLRPDDVEAELRDAYAALRPGGAFAIEVPRVMAERAFAQEYHTPHLLFFSERGLVKLLERVGFKIAFLGTFAGRREAGKKYIAAKFGKILKSPRYDKIKLFNSGDMVPLDRAAANDPRIEGVIKCVALKEST